MTRPGELVRNALANHPLLHGSAVRIGSTAALLAHRIGMLTGPFFPQDGNDIWTHRRRLDSLLLMLDPKAVQRQQLIRVGGQGDGGYIMVDRLREGQVAVSIGVGSDDSWELDLAGRGLFASQFDHTVQQAPSRHPNLSFHPFGLASPSNAKLVPELLDISAITETSASEWGRPPTLLKIDVEGAEWESLATVDPQSLVDYEQILVELHGLHLATANRNWSRAFEALNRLTDNHAPVHVHPNNSWPLLDVAGVPVPHTLEVSLLRRDLVGQQPQSGQQPDDHACVPDRPDTRLSTF